MDETILEMFKIRDNVYDQTTNNIFAALKNIVDGLNKFVMSNELAGIKAGFGNVNWEEIGLQNQNMYIFVGVITIPEGTVVELINGDTATITAETVDYFKRIMKIAIPVEMTKSTPEDVFLFLQKKRKEEDEAIREQEAKLENILGMSPKVEFDFSKLTQEQKNKFMFTEDMMKGKKN